MSLFLAGDARFERATFGSGVRSEREQCRGVEGALGTSWGQFALRDAAAGLLRAVADGEAIDVEQVRGLARAVLDDRVVAAAREVLDGEPAFLLTRAVTLAALILESRPALPAGQAAGSTAGGVPRTVDGKERRK